MTRVVKPIIFSTAMVDALLAGRKTQTRRLLTRRNTLFEGGPWPKRIEWDAMDWKTAFVDPGPSPAGNEGPYLKAEFSGEGTRHRVYPRPWKGDLLWVRETWGEMVMHEIGQYIFHDGPKPRRSEIVYKAGRHPFDRPVPHGWTDKHRWKAPIHLRRCDSRLTLAVRNVRIERLAEISAADSIAEGCEGEFPRAAFSRLWESLHGRESWHADPWVLVLEFDVLKANIDRHLQLPEGEYAWRQDDVIAGAWL